MRKSIITPAGRAEPTPPGDWLDLDQLARVEITSENPEYPVESALLPGGGPGWRAAGPGPQTIRLRFDRPRRVRRIRLRFAEPAATRTQEFVLRWAAAAGGPTEEIVRQQWTFSPDGSTDETEDYRVDLWDVAVLELWINPDISGGDARASLAELRLA